MHRAIAVRLPFFSVLVSIGFVLQLAGVAAAGDSGFVYALQDVAGSSNEIWGFRLDTTTGALTPLPGFPVASGGTGGSLTASENMAYLGGRLYVLNQGDAKLSAFAVDQTTGALSALPFSPIALGVGIVPDCVAVHPSGSPVIVGDSNTNQVLSFVVTATTATAASGSPFATGTAAPFSCAFSRDGNYFYTGGNSGSVFAGFSVDALSTRFGSPFDSGASSPVAFATDTTTLSGLIFVRAQRWR